MKMKRILLVTFLLLAVLTIGAASAEDNNATSDDLQVADDGDDVVELTGYDEDEHYISPNEEDIDLSRNTRVVAEIYLPANTQNGSFRAYNGDDEVARSDINLNDKSHWKIDEDDDELLDGFLRVKDFNLSKINDGDNLTFKFFDYKSGAYVLDERFTSVCEVTITDSIMSLTEIESDDDDDDDDDDDEDYAEGEIQVKNIDLNNTNENFISVIVTEKIGTFIITLDDEETEIFKENLESTKRKPTELDDEDYGTCYCFNFSLADINSYIAQNFKDMDTINDLITYKLIQSGDEMYFSVFEDEDDEDSEITSDSWTVILEDGKIIFDYGDEEEDVYVDYDDENLKVSMDKPLNETVILTYMVKKGIKGTIVICLNDDSTPAFEKPLSEMEYDDYEDDDEVYSYDITVADLNITQAGEYVLHCYFYDENENQICSYDETDLETLIVSNPQIVTGDNLTIKFIDFPIRVDEDKTIIEINDTGGQADDEVIIYVDSKDNQIKIKYDECRIEDDTVYVITSQQLDLGVGQHTINITCKGVNSTDNVIKITTDLEIDFADDVVYTSFNDPFIFISLMDGDITGSNDITGLVNVTLIDSEGNVLPTLQIDIEYMIDSDEDSYLIRPSNVGVELNGTYTVSVIYYNGNKGFVQAEGNVTFKALEADEYGVSISDKIVDDRIITFDDVPFDNKILVEIDDGDTPVTFEKSSLSRGLDSQNKTIYFISQDQLNLTDGSHSIKVSIENGFDAIELANVNVTVDLKENADPALTVSVANIEVGNAATVLITTNSSFTGNVKVQVANKTYDVNVTNGQGNVSVTGLDVGEYIATVTFEADAFFNASVKTAAFNVTAKPVTPSKENTTPVTPAKEDTKPVAKKPKVKLTLKKVKVKRSAKKLVLTATLKINGKAAKKKKIIFKFKGKKYKAKTNKKGVAKVTIKKKVLKKLKKGKKVKIQASYGTTVKKYTVKVRK